MKHFLRYLSVPTLLILHISGIIHAETGCEARARLWKLGGDAHPLCTPFNIPIQGKRVLPYGGGDFLCVRYGIDLGKAELACLTEKTARAASASFELLNNIPQFIAQMTRLVASIMEFATQLQRDLPTIKTQVQEIQSGISRKEQSLGTINKIIDCTGLLSDYVGKLAKIAVQVPPIIMPLATTAQANADLIGIPTLRQVASDFKASLVIIQELIHAVIELQPEVKKMGPALKGLVKAFDDMLKMLT